MACKAFCGFIVLACIASAIGQFNLFEQSSSISITINEELSIGTDVLELPAFCDNINNWVEPDFYTVQVSPTIYFDWSSAAEAIVVTSRLDRDTASPGSTVSFTVTVTSPKCPGTTTLTVDVTLRDINDNPPVPVDLLPSQITHVTSTTPFGAQICVVSATDLDKGINALHTYSLVQGDGTFIIDSVTGVITLAGQVTYTNSPYTIEVQITDTGNPVLPSAVTVVTVHYIISYGPPKFTRNTYTVNINETLATGPLWLVNVTATKSDPDPTAFIVYSIFSAGLLSINPATGAVYIQGPLDVAISPQYVIIVQATLNISSPFNEYFCSSVYRSYAAVRVFVKETINKPPLCLHDLYFFELPENTAVGSLVGTNIGAIDFDQNANGMITYTLVSDTSGGTFRVQKWENIVSLYLLKPVVYENLVNQTFILTLAATDRGGLSCTMTIYVGVEDVNNNPPVVLPHVYCIHEKWTAGVVYCLPNPINVTDLDTLAVNGQIVLSAFHDGRFSIDATQHLCVHDLDYEVEQEVNVTILAKDNGGVPPYNQGYAVFTINVINDNDNAPYFVPFNVSLSLLEQLGYTNFLTLQVYDGDLPPYNNLCVNISDTTNNFTMQQSVLLDNRMSITTAQLSVTAVLQYSVQQEWKIVLWATDLGCASNISVTSLSANLACSNTAVALTSTAMVNVSVISRNNLPPMFTNIIYTGCMLENTTTLTLMDPISTTDPQGRVVSYAIQSQQVPAFTINNATGELRVLNASLVNYESYPPNPHVISIIVAAWNAPDYLHVSVTSTTTVLIKILPVNEFAPEVTAVRVQNQPAVDQFSSVLYSPPEHIYFIPEDKLCNISLPLMALTARDSDAFDETTGCNQSLPYYILESVTPANRLTITESGHVMLTSCLDYSPVYSNGACPSTGDRSISVQVRVCDCQGADHLLDCNGIAIPRHPQCSVLDFTIVVTDVNDNPPIITTAHSACIGVLEDTPGGTPVTTVTAVDCDFGSNAVIYYDILDAGNAGDKFTLNMFNGSIIVSPGAILDYETPQINLTFVVGAYNPTTPLLMSPNNATVDVCLINAHNDPPYFIGCPYDWTIAENDNTLLTGQIVATSEDTTVLGQLMYSLSVPPTIPSTWFTIPNPSSPIIAVNGVDREYPSLTNIDSLGRAIVDFNISVTDGKFTTTCQITAYILDVNDNPPVFNSSMYMAYVDECSPIGTPVLKVYATDADATPQNRIILYTITSGNTNSSFALDLYTGIMTTQLLLNYVITMSYTMSLKASNPDGLYYANYSVTTAYIFVNECNNNPPVFVNCPHEWVINENNNSALTGILATDANINPVFRNLTYSLVVQSPLIAATWFTIPNPSSSDIAVNSVDRELFTSADIDQVLRGVVIMRMDVTDGKFTHTCQVTVYVLDVNDNPPVFNPSSYSLYLNECSPIGTPLFTVYATDADATPQNRIILYAITSGNTNNAFRLDMHTGNMTTQQLLNYLITTNYTMSLTASNPDGLYYTNYSMARADVFVIECNVHGPVFIGCPYYWVINENTITTLTGIVATDANVNPQLRSLMYSLNAQNPLAPIPLTWFTIPDPLSPNISVNSVDRENITEVDSLGRGIVTMTIYVTDGKYTSACQITVLVVDLNDNPPIFNPVNYAATVLECSLNGTTVNTIYATDADATAVNRIIIFTIVGGNPNSTFALDQSTGVVIALGPFDICITPSYTLSISAANPDGLNNSILATDAITVGCCNEHSPIFLSSLYNATVLEYNSLVPPTCSQPAGSLLSVSATDGDCCPVYGNVTGYSIIGGDPLGIFTINAVGSVGVAYPQLIDYEDTISYLLTIAAMDGGTPPLSGIARLSVTVTPQHDHCPVFGVLVYTASVHEDALNGAVLQIYPPITANEGDETNPMISFSISGGPFNITSDGSIVRTTMPVTYIQSRPYYLLTINVTKLQIGQENTSTCTPYCNATALLNVTVLPINTPCIFTSDWVNYCPTLASYIPVGSVVKTVRCVDTDLGLNGKVSYYMYGGNGYFGIDAITGNITVASSLVSSVSAQYTITIVAQDQGSPPLSATITMSFSIALDLNPPYFTRTVFKASASTTTPIGTSLLTVLAMDDDAPLVPAGSILYTIEPWTPPMPFSLDATTGRVYVNSSLSAANIQPFYTFLVKALDGYCWQAVPDAIVDITIVDIVKPRCVFSAPYYQSRTWLLYTANFSVGLWENATIGSLVIDLQNYTSTRLSNFSLISWSPGANPRFRVYSNGSIVVQNTLRSATPDFYIATYNLTVASQCDSSFITTTISIYVLDVNDHSPVLNNISYCIPEYTPIGTNIAELTLHATDVDLYENAYIVYTCTQPAPVFVNAITGVVTLSTTLNRLVINQYPLVLCYATDRNGRGRTTANYLNITVCPYVNHSPYLQPELQNMTICELQPPGLIGKLLAFDVDTVVPFSVIYYSILGGVSYLDGKPSAAFVNQTFPFFVVQTDGRVYTTAPLDRDTVDQYYITVQVSNNDTAAMKNISTIGTLVINVCDVNNHPPVINSSLVCIAQHPVVGTPVTVLTATDKDVADTPFSTVWFWITDQTLGFTTDNVTGLVMANGYNGAAGENVSLPILAYDSYGTYLSLSSTATLEVVVYDTCSQVVMTLCESSQTVENVCQDLITRMLSEATGFGVCKTHSENVGDTVHALTDLYLYFYDNNTYKALPSQSALALIDLNSNLLTYFQRSGCCIKDVKPYTCPALLPSTPVPIWVPSSIAGLLALILSMVCCVACIATSYWCRKYKKLKVSKTVLKRSMTSQLEQFSYQSEVNTTTNPLWVSPYEVDASTVYESQELTIDMFQDDDDDSARTSETTQHNQLYESQELVVDVLTDDGDFDYAPLMTNTPAKNTLYESQELKIEVGMDDDDLEPVPTKQPAKASQERKVEKNSALDPKPGPSKQAPAKPDSKASAKTDSKASAKTDSKSSAKTDSKASAKTDSKASAKTDSKASAKTDSRASAASTKSGPQFESQELKVEMFHDNSEFDLEPLSSSQLSTKSDPLYESQELKIEMFHDNMDDGSELITAHEQTKTSKKTTTQKQQSAKGNSQHSTRHSTPLRTGPNMSDDDMLLEHTLDGSDVSLTK